MSQTPPSEAPEAPEALASSGQHETVSRERVARPSDPDTSSSKRDARERERTSFWEFLKRTYATADPRSLGLLRIALGTLLFVDLARRIPDVETHYSNAGWLTNHFMLFRPMSSHLFSVYLAFSTPGEVYLLMGLHLLVYLLFAVGYRTRLMHVLSVLLLISINSRNIAVENGGYVVLTLLTVWTMFLPLGRRFSVDALLSSLRARREGTQAALNDRSLPLRDDRPVVSLAVAALILQWVTIYYFNVVHKTGPTWRDGTAVHYFFQQDRMVTAFGGFIRDYIPIAGIKAMTYGALLTEALVTVLLVSPFATHKLRMVAWLLVCMLHLSIDSVVQLGPFSYAMMTVFFAFIPREFWEWSRKRLDARRPAVALEFNPGNGFALAVCRFVKRFDGLAKVSFAENADVKSIAVRDGKRRRSGAEALQAVAPALPVPFFLKGLLHVPFFGAWVKRSFKKPGRASTYFELESLPGADEHAPEPSETRKALRRGSAFVREALVVVLMVAAVSQVLTENRAVPAWLKPSQRPEWMTALVIYPRMFQGWSMFAPSPPLDDGVLVVDGLTKDGRRLDPLTGKEPSFDVQPAGGFRMSQIDGDFQRRIHEERFEAYWDGFREFLRNYHQRSGRPEDELVAFEAYFMTERIPPPGQPRTPPTKRKLFSFGKMPSGGHERAP